MTDLIDDYVMKEMDREITTLADMMDDLEKNVILEYVQKNYAKKITNMDLQSFQGIFCVDYIDFLEKNISNEETSIKNILHILIHI